MTSQDHAILPTVTAMTPPATTPATGWGIRFTWTSDPGITHPTQTYDTRPASRERALRYAWNEWATPHSGLTITAVHIRELPDGEWEEVRPEMACDQECEPAAEPA
jgi:hypothetical protein